VFREKDQMTNLSRLGKLCLIIAVLLGSAGVAYALPVCEGSPLVGSQFGIYTWDGCEGTFTFANGDKYVGEFRNGKRHGQGTNTLANGNKYVGEFRNGKPNGQGTNTFANGNKYVGEHRDGKKNGQGAFTFTFTFANGNKYVGEIENERLENERLKEWIHKIENTLQLR